MPNLFHVWLAGMAILIGVSIVRFMRRELGADARPAPPFHEPPPSPMETRIPQVTRDDVERVVRRDFAPGERDAVMALLDEYGGQERDRIALAILKLSRGDLEQVRANVKLANVDFRDVLMLAEYRRASRIEFGRTTPEERAAHEQAAAEDWREYQEWLHAE